MLFTQLLAQALLASTLNAAPNVCPQLLGPLVANPSTASTAPSSSSVEHLVPDLYSSIPPASHLEAGPLTLEVTPSNHHKFVTQLNYSGPDGLMVKGQVSRSIDPSKHWMSFDEARLVDSRQSDRIPSFIRHPKAIDLVPGRGIPTIVFATLQQMRMAGVGFGSLKRASTDEIMNTRTLQELTNHPAIQEWQKTHPHESYLPERLIAQYFWETQSGRYIRTILTQSGHRIVKSSAHYGPYDSPHWSIEMELAPLH